MENNKELLTKKELKSLYQRLSEGKSRKHKRFIKRVLTDSERNKKILLLVGELPKKGEDYDTSTSDEDTSPPPNTPVDIDFSRSPPGTKLTDAEFERLMDVAINNLKIKNGEEGRRRSR